MAFQFSGPEYPVGQPVTLQPMTTAVATAAPAPAVPNPNALLPMPAGAGFWLVCAALNIPFSVFLCRLGYRHGRRWQRQNRIKKLERLWLMSAKDYRRR